MAFFNNLFKKTYTSVVWCHNCNIHSEVKIPRGVTVAQFVEEGFCPSCGCICLSVDLKPGQTESKTKKRPRLDMSLPDVPANAPLNTPAELSQSVFKNNIPVDFWSGMRKKRGKYGSYN